MHKSQIDTAARSLLSKFVAIVNDNDSNTPFTVKSSLSIYLFVVDPSGKVSAAGAPAGAGIYTIGSGGLQIKSGVSVNACITHFGAITCTSCTVNGSAVITPTT